MLLANTFATDFRARREAKTLVGHGYSVQVLCWDRRGSRSRETIDKIAVRNVTFGKTNILATSKAYYVIAALLLQFVIFLWVIRRISESRTLILHAHDFNTLIGAAAAKLVLSRRIRLLYDSHEFTPGIYMEWYGRLISKIVERLEFAALGHVDAIIGANDAVLRHLRRQSSAPAAAVYNCLDSNEVPMISPQDAKKKLGLSGSFVVFFAGIVRQDYNFDLMMRAARDMRSTGSATFRFMFTGHPETMAEIMDAVKKDGLQDLFIFTGWIPERDLFVHYKASDLCYAVTRNIGPNTSILTPIKLFESMACGVPVVVRTHTLAAQIVQRWRCGIAIDPERTSLSKTLRYLRQDKEKLRRLGKAGRIAFLHEFNWNRMESRLLRVYTKLDAERLNV